MRLTKYLALIAVAASPSLAFAGELDINDSGWAITFNTTAKTLTYAQDGKTILKGVFIQASSGDESTLESKSYPSVTLKKESVDDVFGAGSKYTYTYSGIAGKENLEQSIWIYPDKGYLLVDAAVVATSGTTSSRYIAPIVCTTSNTFLPSTGSNYIYDMPHDNDNWVGYSAQPWNIGVANTSCEVSAFYDVVSRQGLIVGSIEHDNWKSGITATPNGTYRLRNLTIAAGVVNKRTNDVWDGRPSLSQHGAISGARVVSPKYFFGYYADWRNGLEDLGAATEKLCPMLQWDKGTIFSWQSWGGMAEKVNYEGAMDVADFFKNQLMPANFHNENGTCYIVLDSFWDNFSDDQLRSFAQHCKDNGQHPGIYHTPFSYWGSADDAKLYRPNGGQYTWAEMAIKANGELRKIASIALDPTHPGTIAYNQERFKKFKDLGFEYIKLDFINNGTLEADDFYAEGVTTGMQAYTYGMNKILEMADGMFVDLSIAPVFPAKGHARRISCDAWGELDNSMYVLNSLNLGWWLDRVYKYNDPDHLVLSRAENEGAARIRYSCGAMTGTVLLGDNYSLKGTCLGNQAERDLAMKIATNADINAVAQIGRSFRPIEGSLLNTFNRWGQYNYGVDNEFVLDTKDAFYYVVFNYDKSNAISMEADFERLGVNKAEIKNVTELWTKTIVPMSGSGFSISVPKCDVRFYRLEKAGWGGTSEIENDKNINSLNISYTSGSLSLKASEAIASVSVYGIDGALLAEMKYSGNSENETLALDNRGIAIVRCELVSGESLSEKVLIN